MLDDDHILVGQRILPVELLRAGFRHISLRDKHNYPLGMANLFVHIKIEDYVPDEYEGYCYVYTCILIMSGCYHYMYMYHVYKLVVHFHLQVHYLQVKVIMSGCYHYMYMYHVYKLVVHFHLQVHYLQVKVIMSGCYHYMYMYHVYKLVVHLHLQVHLFVIVLCYRICSCS